VGCRPSRLPMYGVAIDFVSFFSVALMFETGSLSPASLSQRYITLRFRASSYCGDEAFLPQGVLALVQLCGELNTSLSLARMLLSYELQFSIYFLPFSLRK